MIDRNSDLSISQQAKLLGISRGSVYYLPQGVNEAELALMSQMDELHLEHPFMGRASTGAPAAPIGLRCGQAARTHPDAAHGAAGHGAATGQQQAGAGPQGLPVSGLVQQGPGALKHR